MKPPKKFAKWQVLRRKQLNFERPEDTIQRFNHEPFNLATSYKESKVKPEKIPKWESLAPIGKVPSGSQLTSITERTNYKNWMVKQSHEHGIPPT